MIAARHSLALCLALVTVRTNLAQDAAVAPPNKPVELRPDDSGIGWNNNVWPIKSALSENRPTPDKVTAGDAGDSSNRKVVFIPLRNAHFADVLFTLNKLYEAESRSGKLDYSFDERTNQLIVRSNETLLKEVQAVVEELNSALAAAELKDGAINRNPQRDYSKLRSQLAPLIKDQFSAEQSQLRQELGDLRRRLEEAEKLLGLRTGKKPASNVDKLDKSVLSTMQAYVHPLEGELVDTSSTVAGRASSKSELKASEQVDLRQKLLELELRLMKAEALLTQRDKLESGICEDRLNRMIQTMHQSATTPAATTLSQAYLMDHHVRDMRSLNVAIPYLGRVLTAIEIRCQRGKDHPYYWRAQEQLASSELISSPDARAYAYFLIDSLESSANEKNLGDELAEDSVLKTKIAALKLIAATPDGQAVNITNILESTAVTDANLRSESTHAVRPRAVLPKTNDAGSKTDQQAELRQANAYIRLVMSIIDIRDSVGTDHPKYVEAVRELVMGDQPNGSLVKDHAKTMKEVVSKQLRLSEERFGPEHPTIRVLKSKMNALDAMAMQSADDFRSCIMGILNSQAVVNPDKR